MWGDDLDEHALVIECKRGDYAAFEALYQLYVKRALRTAFLLTQSLPAAEDAVQETFVQVWRRVSTLRDPGLFRPWFYRILLHATHRQGKKERKVVFLQFDPEEHDHADRTEAVPEEQIELHEDHHALRGAIASLTETLRIPLALRYYSGLPDSEIAAALGIPVGTVKSRLYNARQTLHRLLSAPVEKGVTWVPIKDSSKTFEGGRT